MEIPKPTPTLAMATCHFHIAMIGRFHLMVDRRNADRGGRMAQAIHP
jgi:hypothetical protein